MPTYEFRCRTCGSTFEERRAMADASEPATCPDGHLDTVRLLSVFASARSGAGAPAPTPAPAARPTGGACCGGGCH